MVFNMALVLAAVIGAVILPTDGKSVLILVVLAVGYLAGRGLVRRRQPRDLSMNKGTESLAGDRVPTRGPAAQLALRDQRSCAAHQASSSSRARSGPSGPSSIRRSSR